MNPSLSEEDLVTTQDSDTSLVTTVTYTSTPSVTQVTNSTSYVPLNLRYQPQQHPPRYSYNSSGYQNSFLNYQECPINFDRPDCTYPPTKVQEIYNIYCLNDHANHTA